MAIADAAHHNCMSKVTELQVGADTAGALTRLPEMLTYVSQAN